MPYDMRMDESAVRRFRQAYWRAARELDTVRLRLWERSHVTLPQLRVLFQVRRTPGITTGDLARSLGIAVSTSSGLVSKLADRGLIARLTAQEDRRQAPLRLTEAGAALAGELSDTGRPFLERVAAELGGDLSDVTAALERLAQAANMVRERTSPVDASVEGEGADGGDSGAGRKVQSA